MPRAPPDQRTSTLRIVVEPAARDGGEQVGRDRVRLAAADEAGEVEGMDADVGKHCRLAGARRVGAPLSLLLAVGVDRLGQPVLDIGGMYGDEPSELTVRHHFARLADHRVAGVVERHEEFAPPRGGQRDQRLRVGQRGRQRLVADHVDARLQEGRCDRRMQMVGRHDDDRLDAVRPALPRLSP